MIWKSIPTYEGHYEVSSAGQVRSVKGGRRLGKILSAPKTHDGYPRVTLKKDGVSVSYTVHVLIATAFLGPRPKGKQVDHKDGNKDNASVENLEYVTAKINGERAAFLGLKARGERQGSAKLTANKVREFRQRYAAGESMAKIAVEFGVSVQALHLIHRGRNWAWLD